MMWIYSIANMRSQRQRVDGSKYLQIASHGIHERVALFALLVHRLESQMSMMLLDSAVRVLGL
jgi:hypothetical protein